jgi:hypothetical protein
LPTILLAAAFVTFARSSKIAARSATTFAAHRAIFAGVFGVFVCGCGIFRPRGEKKFFQIKFRFWSCTHDTSGAGASKKAE